MRDAKSRGKRRKARELALAALYMLDMQSRGTGQEEETKIVDRFFKERNAAPAIIAYARRLTDGVLEQRKVIDLRIEEASENWKLNRIARVDRNILRISAFEILFDSEVPPQVSINEAVEIAKKYGSDESHAFVNGILDHIRKATSP